LLFIKIFYCVESLFIAGFSYEKLFLLNRFTCRRFESAVFFIIWKTQ